MARPFITCRGMMISEDKYMKGMQPYLETVIGESGPTGEDLDRAHEALSTVIHQMLNDDLPYAIGSLEEVSSFTSTLVDRIVGEGYDCDLSSIIHYPCTPEVLIQVVPHVPCTTVLVPSMPRIRVRYCMESTWTRWDYYNSTTPISPYYTVSTYYGNYGGKIVGIQVLLNELPRIRDWMLMRRQ